MPKGSQSPFQIDTFDPADCLSLSVGKQALDFLIGAYGSQLATCSLLENIADMLPDPPHSYISQSLISKLTGNWATQIIGAEEKLFSLLEHHYNQHCFVPNLLDRLRIERQSDTDLASELAGTFETILQTQKVPDPESFGYMLRGVFETQRRQVELKKAVMLPLAENMLQPLSENKT